MVPLVPINWREEKNRRWWEAGTPYLRSMARCRDSSEVMVGSRSRVRVLLSMDMKSTMFVIQKNCETWIEDDGLCEILSFAVAWREMRY